jgi:thiamine-phosphate diphosphorylase
VTALRTPGLCLVTDRHQVAPDARTRTDEISALERWLEDALDADLDLIQIRERDLDARDLVGLVRRVVDRRAGRAVRVVVNDRADVAVSGGADGVHLRGDGPGVEAVRTLASSPWLVGRSVHTPDEVRQYGSADYLLFGTVFPGGSKGANAPVQGVDALHRAVAASRTPVLAIGGITPARAREAVAVGAAGVAAIGIFLPEGRRREALGPRRGAAALRAAMLQ